MQGFCTLNLRLLALLCLPAASVVTQAADTPPASLSMDGRAPFHYDFEVEKGAGTPVCDAYVQRLRNTDFYRLPQCDRPENVSVAGFEKIGRVPLKEAETRALYEPVKGLLFYDDPDYFKKWRADRARRGQDVVNSGAEIGVHTQAVWAKNGYQTGAAPPPLYFRLEPVDLDNNGTRDHVIVWKDEAGAPCGAQWEHGLFLADSPTYLALFNASNELDIERTRELRKKGETLGVFLFQGTYYIDTFRSSPSKGDLEGQFQGGESVSDVLSVYYQKNGASTLACEIRWYDRSRN